MVMINLFSVFDPTSYYFYPLGWIILFLLIIIFSMNIYILRVGYLKILKSFWFFLEKIFIEIRKPNYLGVTIIRIIIFICIFIINIIGLFPFIFTSTAFPNFTIGIGVVLWVSFFLIGWIKNFKIRAAHLVPEGRPILLAPLIVLIERIRHLIRPFTLSIRLAANIIAGHLIIGLLSSIRLLNYLGFIRSLLFQRILLILELGVAIIQRFVFRILLLLYVLEYY